MSFDEDEEQLPSDETRDSVKVALPAAAAAREGNHKTFLYHQNSMENLLSACAESGVFRKPRTVWHAFEQTVRRYDCSTALCGFDGQHRSRWSVADPQFDSSTESQSLQHLTWFQYFETAKLVAHFLVRHGLEIGDGAIFASRISPALCTLNLGVLGAGGVVCHIRTNWFAHELRDRILPIANAKLLVLDRLTDNFLQVIQSMNSSETTGSPSWSSLASSSSPNVDISAGSGSNGGGGGGGCVGGSCLRGIILLQEPGLEEEEVFIQKLEHVRSLVDSSKTFVISYYELIAAAQDASGQVRVEMPTSHILPSDCCAMSFGYDEQGQIRAVCLSHDNVMFTASMLASSFGPLLNSDRMVAHLPLFHVAAQIVELFMPITCGMKVFCGPSYNVPLVEVLKKTHPTIFFATPETWNHIGAEALHAKSEANPFLYRWAKKRAVSNCRKLLNEKDARRSLGHILASALVLNSIKKKLGLGSTRVCCAILATLSLDLLNLFNSIDIPVYQLHGVPETSGFGTINAPHKWVLGSYGCELRATAFETNPDTNEILYRGRNVFLGYKTGATKPVPQVDANGWYASGQFGHRTPETFLYITTSFHNYIVLSTGDTVPVVPLERAFDGFPELQRVTVVGEDRSFLTVLLFLKTMMGPRSPSRSSPASTPHDSASFVCSGNSSVLLSGPGGGSFQKKHFLADEAMKVSKRLGSRAVTVQEVHKCPLWAVHIDSMLQLVYESCGISGPRVRKWFLMCRELSVDRRELDDDTGRVRRQAVDLNYKELLDTVYE